MPLVAVNTFATATASIDGTDGRIHQRSRAGSEAQYRIIAEVAIEGIEDLADIADSVA
jgi:hypothetical protein